MADYLVDSPVSLPRDSSTPTGGRDAFLASLNAQQRLAVEHGIGPEERDEGPLLVIAGAGSGKTNTLAYRVAHLVRNGADPQRILLLTFSRRAAAEMERRAGQHPASRARRGDEARRRPRCRGRAPSTASARACCASTRARIGLHESFTILDRGDAEDLLAIVRHELGCRATKRGFRPRPPASRSTRASSTARRRCRDVLERAFPGARRGKPS